MKVHIFQNIASTTHITKGLRLQKMKGLRLQDENRRQKEKDT